MENGWHILLSEPRRERTVVAGLAAYGIKAYCPELPPRRKVRRGRVVQEQQVAMPGYLFVPAGEIQWSSIRMVRGIRPFRPFLECQGRPAVLSDAALGILRDGVQEKWERRGRYGIGDRVRIVDPSSPFNDLVAQVERIGDKGFLRALVDLFNRKVPVEFTEDQVEAA